MKKRLQTQLQALRKAFSDKPELNTHFDAIGRAIETLVDQPTGGSSMDIDETLIKTGADFFLYSDGACRGNPGPGSWASLGQTKDGQFLFEDTGVEMLTTNNRMELMGAIRALECYISTQNDLKAKIVLCTDSQYVIKGMETWVAGWKARGWKKADNKTPENVDLWQQLDLLQARFGNLQMHWVRGHNGHPQNERCDRMANEALDMAGF